MALLHYIDAPRASMSEDASLKTPVGEYTSPKMDISDNELKLTFIKYIEEAVPQLIATETGMKYSAPRGSAVPHYRIMKIWHSTKRSTIEADITWWKNRILTNKVPQCIWMGEIMASSVDLLWKGFGHYVNIPKLKKDESLDEVVQKWVETILKIKNTYFRELDEIARTNPDVVFTAPQPIKTTRTAASVSSSMATLPIVDEIEE